MSEVPLYWDTRFACEVRAQGVRFGIWSCQVYALGLQAQGLTAGLRVVPTQQSTSKERTALAPNAYGPAIRVSGFACKVLS